MDHLLEPAHGGPKLLTLDINRGIILEQLILARGQAPQNRRDMGLRRFVAVKIVAHFIAIGDDPEQLFAGEQIALLARIKILNRATKLRKVSAHARFLVHRTHGPIQETIGLPGRIRNFLASHIGQLINLLAKFGRVGIKRRQFLNKGIGLGFQRRNLLGLQRHKA